MHTRVVNKRCRSRFVLQGKGTAKVADSEVTPPTVSHSSLHGQDTTGVMGVSPGWCEAVPLEDFTCLLLVSDWLAAEPSGAQRRYENETIRLQCFRLKIPF